MYRAWAVTIRPLDGLGDEMIDRFRTMADKLVGCYAVTEKTGVERHLHAGLFFAKGVRKSQVVERMKVVQGEMSDAEERVMKMGVKVMYNDAFIDEYLTKGDDTVVLVDDVPDERDEFYPSQEEQAKAMAGSPVCRLELYRKAYDEVSLGRCLDFLRGLWFTERSVPPPRTEAMQFEEAKKLFCSLSLA